MIALNEQLRMQMQRATLLALDGPVHRINPAENAARCSRIATKNVHAWRI